VLKNLKLRATLTGLLIAAFTWTGAFAQNSPVLNQPQPSTNYVRSYSIASAKEAFNADGLAEPTLQPSPELTLATSTLATPTLATPDDDALPQSTGASSANSPDSHKRGLISRSIRRTLQDQKELYAAPFHRQNLKWDAMFLVGTAALIATDRQSARAISNTHINTYRNMSNASIAGLGVGLGGIQFVAEEFVGTLGDFVFDGVEQRFVVGCPRDAGGAFDAFGKRVGVAEIFDLKRVLTKAGGVEGIGEEFVVIAEFERIETQKRVTCGQSV